MTMVYIFVSQFVNTGIILLLVHSNFENSNSILQNVFNGSYPDFTMDWYYKVGSVYTQTLII
jgi:hypothetical protein